MRPGLDMLMMNEEADGSDNRTGGQTKVDRLIDEYGLGDIGMTLEERWTATGDERMSLRALADYFNRQLLEEAMDDVGATPVSGEVETVYSLLEDGEERTADTTRIRRRLQRKDIDVDGLLEDFVSYQAIRTYLRDHRGVEYEREVRDQASVEAENIQRLRGRTKSVTESKLEQLDRRGDLVVGRHRTIVDINVICEDCGRQFDIEDLLERGRCDCAVPDDVS